MKHGHWVLKHEWHSDGQKLAQKSPRPLKKKQQESKITTDFPVKIGDV